MAALLVKVIPSFHSNYSDYILFISENTYEKFILIKEIFIALKDGKMSIPSNSKIPILLLVGVEGLQQILDAFCFTHQLMDCNFTALK